MAALGSLAKLIRSKNAAPWHLTIDIMLADEATYRRVIDANVITQASMGEMFQLDPERVDVYHYEPANTIKVSIPRHVPNGDPADTDIFGGQQFAPLVDLDIP